MAGFYQFVSLHKLGHNGGFDSENNIPLPWSGIGMQMSLAWYSKVGLYFPIKHHCHPVPFSTRKLVISLKINGVIVCVLNYMQVIRSQNNTINNIYFRSDISSLNFRFSITKIENLNYTIRKDNIFCIFHKNYNCFPAKTSEKMKINLFPMTV